MNPGDEIRYRLTLHYDGSDFFGWQLQPKGRTVQGEIEAALERITGSRRTLTGSGRTDTGVHATGQVATLVLPPRWEEEELHRALNAVLPRDIWVESVRPVPLDFHPRKDAVARSYLYQVGLDPACLSPFHRPWCWPLLKEVDLDLLHRGAALLPGRHSFKAFAKTGQEMRGDVCQVSEASWGPFIHLGLAFHITANRFLHHMVRYLMGTLVEVGRGRRSLDEMAELMSDPETKLVTSPPAPPEGLFLARVHYPEPESELD